MLKECPLISIVTINYNTTEVTCDFLRSLNDHLTYPNTEVIVVDNASAENPCAALKAIYPSVKVIMSNENLGFAGGNNLGLKHARGEFFFIVNNDTEVTPGMLENLLKVFLLHPDAGIVCPKFHYFFAKGTIEYAGYEKVSNLTGRNGMVGCREKDNGQHDQLAATHYAHGGAMLVSGEVLRKAGLMDEIFFLYYEEFDWAEQIKRKGFRIYYQPAALIYHKESMTTGKASPLKTYYLTRNRILFMRRNRTVFPLSVFLLYFTFFTVPKNTLAYGLRGQFPHLRSFWKGILWHFNSRITFN